MTPAPPVGVVIPAAGFVAGAVAFVCIACEFAKPRAALPPERGDAPGDAWGRGFTVGIFVSDGNDGVASVTKPPARGCAGLVWAVVAEMAAKAVAPRLPAVVPDGETGLADKDRLGRATV